MIKHIKMAIRFIDKKIYSITIKNIEKIDNVRNIAKGFMMLVKHEKRKFKSEMQGYTNEIFAMFEINYDKMNARLNEMQIKEIRDFLYLLIPAIYDVEYYSAGSNIIDNLSLVTEYIEKEIPSINEDQIDKKSYIMICGMIGQIGMSSSSIHENMRQYVSELYNKYNLDLHEEKLSLIECHQINLSKIIQSLNKLTILEIQELLYQLVQAIYRTIDNKYCCCIKNLKETIKYIDKMIKKSQDDELKNTHDLVNENHKLKYENDGLKKKISIINNLINDDQNK